MADEMQSSSLDRCRRTVIIEFDGGLQGKCAQYLRADGPGKVYEMLCLRTHQQKPVKDSGLLWESRC